MYIFSICSKEKWENLKNVTKNEGSQIHFDVTNTFTLTLSPSTVSAVEMHISSIDAMHSDHDKCNRYGT